MSLDPEARIGAIAGAEHRYAWSLPAAAQYLELEVEHADDRLSFGVSPTSDEAPVRVTVVRDGKTLVQERSAGSETWSDFHVDLPQPSPAYRVYFECDAPFWLSHCQVETPDYETPNVLIFLVDTQRADHLGCYGHDKNTSPNLDAFAKSAIQFTGAIAQSSWTRSSVASLFTSMYPEGHGVLNRHEVLKADLPSLAKAFHRGGYETIGINTNDNLAMRWGFGADFDRYIDLTSVKSAPNDRDKRVIELATETLRARDGVPVFMYVHIMAPHSPYAPPPPFRSMFKDRTNPTAVPKNPLEVMKKGYHENYEGDVAFADSLFGELMDGLRELGLFDRTIVAMVSDHGEGFHEHGNAGHGQTLFDEETIVPLLIKPATPNVPGRTVQDMVELLDVGPTLLELAGLTADPAFQGRSLLPLLVGEHRKPPYAYSRLVLDWRDIVSVRSDAFKYLVDAKKTEPVWYDLHADPGEQAPLREPPAGAAALQQYAQTRAAQDGVGLHILLVDKKGTNRTIDGAITVNGMDRFDLHHPGREFEVTRDQDTVAFRGNLGLPPNSEGSLLYWFENSRITDFVKFRADVSADSEVGVTLETDGSQTGDPATHIGQNGAAMPLDGTLVPIRELIARPDRYQFSALPEEYALYAWYVPPVQTIRDEELPAEVLENLKALGYVH